MARNAWETVFINRIENNGRIILSMKEHAFMYNKEYNAGRSKILYSERSKLFDSVPFHVENFLKPIILAIYHNWEELKNSKGMILKKFKRKTGLVPRAFSTKMRPHIINNMRSVNTTEWKYFIDNNGDVFNISEKRCIDDKLSEDYSSIIKKSVEYIRRDN